MRTSNRSRHDVVIVGGRVAGSATAMLLARLGHDVVVVDQALFPSDTVSTHSIARSGVVQLRRWGLLDAVLDSGAPAIRQVTFHALGDSVSRPVKLKAGIDFVVAPRVYGRDRVGAPIDIGARYVIGADGLQSRVARSVGAAISEVRQADGATQYAYYAGIPWTGNEFFVGARSLAGVFPTHGGQACIWICNPSADAKAVRRRTASRSEAFCELLERSAPQLAERLRHARRTSPVSGMLRMPNQLRQAFGPGWALVGDAGYHRDAVTGYGISDAFRDAEFLAVALDQALGVDAEETAALTLYQQQRDQALREIFEITCRLAAYPAVPAFIELQKQLSAAIDKQAAALAARPVPGERLLATA